MKALPLALVSVLLSGCILTAGLGDSNTNSTPGHERWVKRLAPFMGYVFFEHGRGGATIKDYANCTGDCATTTCAREQLACSLAGDKATLFLLAYGTNDLIYLLGSGGTLQQIVDAMQMRVDEAALGGARAYVALTPPVFCPPEGCALGITEGLVEALNALVIAHFGLENVLDFWTGFTAADFLGDGVHLTDAGQQKRAEIARAFLLVHP